MDECLFFQNTFSETISPLIQSSQNTYLQHYSEQAYNSIKFQ